jgi:hypothetical protein
MEAIPSCLILIAAAGCASAVEPTTFLAQATDSSGALTRPPASEIVIVVSPNAACTLRANANISGAGMPVSADVGGLVHLQAAKTLRSETYTLDCDGDGETFHYVFDLADGHSFASAAPAAPLAQAERIRPALSNPMKLSDTELIARGYPPRPDPVRAPKSYERWLAIVSMDFSIVVPNSLARGDLTFGNPTYSGSPNWCGIMLNQSDTRYVAVEGVFNVPTFLPVGAQSNSSLWVGLGNDDIIQTGIFFQSEGSAGQYGTFHQFLPATLVVDRGMPIAPGDQFYFWAWEGDSNCDTGSGQTGWGCYMYSNATQGKSTPLLKETVPNGHFSGATAEAIMERQNNPGYPVQPLAPWMSASAEFGAWDLRAGGHNIASDDHVLISLVNDGLTHNLALPSSLAPDAVSYEFLASE